MTTTLDLPLAPSDHARAAALGALTATPRRRPAAPVSLAAARGLATPSLHDPSGSALGVPTATAPQQRLADLLATLPLFEHLPLAERLGLARNAQVRRARRDELLVRQGDTDTQPLLVLVSGRAYVERTGDTGRQVLLDVLERGARIGELSLLDGSAQHASVRSVSACELLAIPSSDVLNGMRRSPLFCHAWTTELVRRMRQANQRVMTMSLHGVRDRVLARLQLTAEPDAEGCQVVPPRYGRTELARMVGASREMVCRVLRGLAAEGAIALRQDRSIALLAPACAYNGT